MKEDCNLLHLIETKYPNILFQAQPADKSENYPKPDPKAVMEAGNCKGATLVFSDTSNTLDGATVVNLAQLSGAYDSYEQGILDLSKQSSFADLESVIQQIFVFASKIRRGGRILIPQSTYAHLPYGMDGMEILLKVVGLRIELPLEGMVSVLVASVE